MRLKKTPLFSIAAKNRFTLDDKAIEEIEILAGSIDTHPFKNLIAIIYYNLKRNNYLKKIPKNSLSRLKEGYYNAIYIDMQQRGWLEDFIRRRLPSDLRVILLKGSSTWGTIYPLKAPRTGCDIDILVRERDFDRITAIMDEIADRQILDESRVFTNRAGYEYSYRVRDLPVAVEIHRALSHPFVGDVNIDALFEGARVHPYYRDNRVLILSPLLQLINIFVHSIKHADITAQEIVDSYRIIKRYRLSIEEISKMAKRHRLSQYSALFLGSVFELIDDISEPEIEFSWTPLYRLKREIFSLLHHSEIRISLRIRQLLSLLLIDNLTDVLRFSSFYTTLRLKDLIYYYLSGLRGGTK